MCGPRRDSHVLLCLVLLCLEALTATLCPRIPGVSPDSVSFVVVVFLVAREGGRVRFCMVSTRSQARAALNALANV